MLRNRFILFSGLAVLSSSALFAGSALAAIDISEVTASVDAVLSVTSPDTVDFGAITPPQAGVTDASAFNVTIISNGTPTTSGYTLAANYDDDPYTQAISLIVASDPNADTTTTAPFTSFTALTTSVVEIGRRTAGSGITAEAGESFSVNLRLPTFAWQAAAASAIIGEVTFTATAL